MAPPEVEIDVILVNDAISIIGSPNWASTNDLAQGGSGTDAISYPSNAETVSSPVTFTGTSGSGKIVELWDTTIKPALTHIASASNIGTAAGGTQSTTVSCAAGTMLLIACQAQATTAVQSGVASCTVGGSNARLVRGGNVETYSRTEIWAYWASTALSSATVTFTLTAATACDTAIIVTGVAGADEACIGNSGGSTFAGTGSPSVNLRPTHADSTLFSVTHAQTTPASAGTNQVEIHEVNWNSALFQTQRYNSTLTWGTNVALTSSFTSSACSMQVLEVRPAMSGGGNIIYDSVARSVGSNPTPDWWYNGYTTIPTITLNYATAPDGSSEATRIQYTTGGNPELTPRFAEGGGLKFPVAPSTQYTMSWWVRDIGITATTPTMRLRYVPYIGTAAQTTVQGADNWATISGAAGAWVRLSYTFTTAASVDGANFVFLATTVASGNIDILAWGAKVELGATATGTYL